MIPWAYYADYLEDRGFDTRLFRAAEPKEKILHGRAISKRTKINGHRNLNCPYPRYMEVMDNMGDCPMCGEDFVFGDGEGAGLSQGDDGDGRGSGYYYIQTNESIIWLAIREYEEKLGRLGVEL